MDTYTVEKYQQNLHEICPSSQKYSEQHVTFQEKKMLPSSSKTTHLKKEISLLPKSSVFFEYFCVDGKISCKCC
jgi:hypothetical protein